MLQRWLSSFLALFNTRSKSTSSSTKTRSTPSKPFSPRPLSSWSNHENTSVYQSLGGGSEQLSRVGLMRYSGMFNRVYETWTGYSTPLLGKVRSRVTIRTYQSQDPKPLAAQAHECAKQDSYRESTKQSHLLHCLHH